MHIGIPWAFWTGMVLTLIGLLVLSHAIFSDALKGRRSPNPRRRCPKCWYDMAGAPGLTCPECGRTAKGERRLTRPRRRWRRACLALPLIAAGLAGVYNAPLASIDWVHVSPSMVLVYLLDDPTITENTSSRTNTRTGAQLRIYNEVIDRYAAGTLSLANRRALAEKQFVPGLPPVSLHTRVVWPTGEALAVRVVPKFGGVLPRRFEARATFDGAEHIVAYDGGLTQRSGWGRTWWQARPVWAGGLQTLGTPSGPLDSITIEGRVLEGDEEIWHGSWGLNVRVTDRTDDEVFLAAASEELTDVIRDAIMTSLRVVSRTNLAIDIPAEPKLLNTAVSLTVEIVRRDQTMASAELAWTLSESKLDSLRLIAEHPEADWLITETGTVRAPVTGDLDAIQQAKQSPEGWTVRVRGTPAQLRRSFGFEHYWAGEFEIPFDEVFKDEP